MKIYLVRHSNAADLESVDSSDDSQRPLTEKGRQKMDRIAASLRSLGLKPDLIVSSPYARAAQTAEILASGLKYKGKLAFSESLVPEGSPDAIIGEINEKYSVDELVLVGHEPSLSSLMGTLIAGTPEVGFDLKKGGVCCLAADDLHLQRSAVLEWLLTPKILSAVA